ncbi:hypothetical protein HK405_011693, partial [Cladochytrium tenue]
DPDAMLVNHPVACRRLVAVVIQRCEAQGWIVPEEYNQLAEKTDAEPATAYKA